MPLPPHVPDDRDDPVGARVHDDQIVSGEVARPELELLLALEQRTAAACDAAVLRFRNGRITTKSLAELIDGTILPEVHAARARVTALQRVPLAHKPLVTAANDYLKLRDESWRLRAVALTQANMRLLRQADQTERASLEAFAQLKTGSATVLPKS